MKKQEKELRELPDIVIATPGRLLDHIQNTPSFGLSKVEILVLDEADRMLDEFFAEQVNFLFGHWLIDWILDRFIDWLIDWLIGYLIGWLIDWSLGIQNKFEINLLNFTNSFEE